MSKAEEWAIKEFPVEMGLEPDDNGEPMEVDHNRFIRPLATKIYKFAEKDIISCIREQIERWTPVDWGEHFTGERVAFRSVLSLLREMEEEL